MTITVNENNKTFPITLLTSELFKSNENNDGKTITATLNDYENGICWRALCEFELRHDEIQNTVQKLRDLFCENEDCSLPLMSIVREVKKDN